MWKNNTLKLTENYGNADALQIMTENTMPEVFVNNCKISAICCSTPMHESLNHLAIFTAEFMSLLQDISELLLLSIN